MKWKSIERAKEKWLEELSYGRDINTIRNLKNHLNRLLEHFDDDPSSITIKSYHKWLQVAKDKWAESTVSKTHSTSIRLLKWMNHKHSNEIANLRLTVALPRILTFRADEINSILKWSFEQDRPGWQMRCAAFMLILSTSGMRGGECQKLKWADLNEEEFNFHLTNTKSGTSRFAPIHPKILPFLKNYRYKMNERLQFNSRWVFPSFIHPDNFVTYTAITGKLSNEVSNSLGFKINAKKFRSTMVKLVIESGGGYENGARIVGHANIGVTQRHYHRIKMNPEAQNAHSKALHGFDF